VRLDIGIDPNASDPLEAEIPAAFAIVERVQWLVFGGICCAVFVVALDRNSLGIGGTREGSVLLRLSPGTPSSRHCP
jgi:hypothetical protein